jgi:hypothetical protein
MRATCPAHLIRLDFFCMENIIQESRSPGGDLNPGPPEYEGGVLTTRQRRSVS